MSKQKKKNLNNQSESKYNPTSYLSGNGKAFMALKIKFGFDSHLVLRFLFFFLLFYFISFKSPTMWLYQCLQTTSTFILLCLYRFDIERLQAATSLYPIYQILRDMMWEMFKPLIFYMHSECCLPNTENKQKKDTREPIQRLHGLWIPDQEDTKQTYDQ